MKKLKLVVVATIGVALAGCQCPCHKRVAAPAQVRLGAHSAVTPIDRPDRWWHDRHNAMVERVKQGNVDLIFIGDSITHNWENYGNGVWQKYYGTRNAVNLGIGADSTQHVLWRLEHGALAGISPKLAVVLIGTNNLNTAQEIADGIIAIVQKLRSDLPHTKVLLLAIFPHGEKPSAVWDRNAQASLIASKVADNKMVFYEDINHVFLNKDGMLSKDIMPDFLHPNAKGYELEAAAIEPTIARLMKSQQ